MISETRWIASFQHLQYRRQYAIDFLQNLVVTKAKYAVTLCVERFGSPCIRQRARVLTSVDFDNLRSLPADEIDIEPRNGKLADKFPSRHLPITQMVPRGARDTNIAAAPACSLSPLGRGLR